MNIIESIESIQKDIENQMKRLAMFEELAVIFKGVQFPEKILTYAQRLNDGSFWLDFSPGYEDDAPKDLQPFVHHLCQHFSIKLEKQKRYSNDSLEYVARFEKDGVRLRLAVSGVVPKSCRVIEKKIALTPEELKEERSKARKSVKKFRIEREIICTPEDEEKPE